MKRGVGAREASVRGGIAAFVAMLSAGALLIGVASAAAAGVEVGGQQVRQTLRYWTPTRMREAVPLEAPAPTRPAFASQGGRPRGASSSSAAAVDADSSFVEVGDPTTPELRPNGVIFFTFLGFPARCSGTSVRAPNRSVVFTAGHCVAFSFGKLHWLDSKWVFVPAYRFGQRPFGVFPATHLDATRLWTDQMSEDGDVGAAVVSTNGRGERLANAVGAYGIAWNKPANQVFDVHGYPAEDPFDGETQRLCSQRRFLGHDPLAFVMPGPLNLGVGCQVAGGASGGAWTIDGATLNSVTDYDYDEDPGTVYGAYFGTEVARLYGRVAKLR